MEERAIQRGRTQCTERVKVTLQEYERVRADGATFLLAPGHRDASIERIVLQRPRFPVVEKVNSSARAVVRALNPRAAPT
jgi:hypothetical protein